MSARSSTTPCDVTPTRLLWLQHLEKHGESRWQEMPKRINGLGSVTSATWNPLVNAGLIKARFGQRHFSELPDWLFTITDAGRAAMAKAAGSAS